MSGINDQAESELVTLTAGYCDDSLSDDECARLEQFLINDIAARNFFRRYLGLDAALRDYGENAAAQWMSREGSSYRAVTPTSPSSKSVSEHDETERMDKVRPSIQTSSASSSHLRKSRFTVVSATAIGIVFVVGLAALIFDRGRVNAAVLVGSLEEVSGDVRILAGDGKLRTVASNAPLRAGDMVRTSGAQSSAVLAYPDGTRLTLVGNTSTTCGDQNLKRIVIHQGTLAASVRPQPSDQPLVLNTPSAQVEVLGTRFLIEAIANRTDLNVTEGRVRLVRISDGEAVEVSNGEYAGVTEQNKLFVQGIPPLAMTWEVDFEKGLPEGWSSGEWTTIDLPVGSHGAVKPAPYESDDGKTYDGIRTNEAWLQGLFAVGKRSHLHFTFKMSNPNWINVFLVTRTKDPTELRFSGNYLFNQFPKITPDEWQTVSIPLANFERLHSGDLPLEQLAPFKLMIVSDRPDRGLVIDRIWVTPDGPGVVELRPID